MKALLVALLLLVGCTKEGTKITNTTNIFIEVHGVRCFFINVPGVGSLPAVEFVDNQNGTVSRGGVVYEINVQCNVVETTTTTGKGT